MTRYAFLTLVFLVAGCTSVKVQPVDPSLTILHVCIRQNPQVEVEVYYGNRPRHCEYILTYSARRSWDLKTYLSQAELRLLRRGQQIASADYHLRAKGGLSLTKFAGTKSKMDPVIDKLLSGS